MEGWKQGAKNSLCYGYDKENILLQTAQMASGLEDLFCSKLILSFFGPTQQALHILKPNVMLMIVFELKRERGVWLFAWWKLVI